MALVLTAQAESPEKELTDFTAAGFDRRLGPAYSYFHKNESKEDFPTIWKPPTKEDVPGHKYEIGGPWSKEPGDFSSTQGQVLYVPDGGGFGMDRVTILEMAHNTYTESPQPPWHGGAGREPQSLNWPIHTGGSTAVPISMARGNGNWSNCGVAIFSTGLITTAGTVTAKGTNPTLQLPSGKVPTAISVTPKNEFALVTVYDTKNKKGQVAVIALESNGSAGRAGRGFAHEWRVANPGLCNVAVFSNMKLLGFVDLLGIAFPTAICATGDTMQNRFNGPAQHAGMLSQADLNEQSWRDSFSNGNNRTYATKAGYAVVASKYEQKAAFIDLQPLFDRACEMYFTTAGNYAKTRELGPGPNQWPYTFDADPGWKPKVVKVIDVPTPTAVLASIGGGKRKDRDSGRAFIASMDGRVGIYAVGGLANDAPASAGDVRRVGDVQVGRNPVCLAYQKRSRDTFIVASRGDREIAWVQYSGSGGRVVQRLRDARLLDPVYVEQADTHGTNTQIITVADFKGRKIINYRYGEVHFATNGGARFGMGPDGKASFECGGVMEFPGNPFCVSATNVN